ncbi:hypothetical protein, partial [Burkholderia latens]|uniref:hypothetical protein n=1 Tax=Burkholderia latens TaxID=488446 RepID=UPI001BA67474
MVKLLSKCAVETCTLCVYVWCVCFIRVLHAPRSRAPGRGYAPPSGRADRRRPPGAAATGPGRRP